jgi:vitamin B12 transporter
MSSRKIPLLVLVLLVSGVGGHGLVMAADGAQDSVLVTATRTPTPESEILVPVVVITRAELERSLAEDAADTLRFQAGLDIGRNGGPGQPASLFLRGTDSNHTIVLIDGIRVNPGTIGGAALENIPAESIERIEIVKGPRSTLYGSDAIGGVVNIFTRGARSDGIDAYAGFGRYDTRSASFVAGMQFERGGLGLSGSWLDSAGFPSRTDTTTDRGYRNLSFSLQGRWLAGPVELRASAWRAAGTSEYSDFFLTPVDSDFDDHAAALEAAFAATDDWRMSIRATAMQNEIEQNQSTDHLRTRRTSLEWQNDVTLGSRQSLTFGAMASHEHAVTAEFDAGFDVHTDVVLAFVEDRLSLGRHHVLVAGGYTDHDTAGSKFTWNVDYGFDLSRRIRLLAAAGTAFRAPDSTDRFGFGGNPALKPESSRNVELGLQWRPNPQQRFTLSAFRNQIDELIEFVVSDPVTFDGSNENVGRARIEGVEASYRISGAGWHFELATSLQNPRNLTERTRLLRRTRESLTLSMAKSFGRYQLGASLLTAGARKDFGVPSAVTLAPYTLVDLTGKVAVTPRLDIDARVENALDERYELASGYNTPRRSLFVGARYRFGAN